MRRGAKLTGLIAAGLTLAPVGMAALLASIAVLPYGGGASRPFLTWPLKLLAFLTALVIAATVGMMVALLTQFVIWLSRRLRAP